MIKVLRLLIIASICFTFSAVILNCQSEKPKVWGVVTGISNYQNVPKLKYADKDALAFYNFLIAPLVRSADTNNIKLLLNEKATSYNFFEAMDHLLEVVQENDFVYIYFAGHGDVEKKTDRQNGFLICYSSPQNCYAAGGSISVRFLQDYLETLSSKNKAKVVLIIDACRAGKLAGGSEGSEVTAASLKAEWKGVVKILSCQPGETSLEGEQWGGGSGVFTHFLLKGLTGLADENGDGDGKVSLRELYNYLDKNVTKETDNKQMPEIVGDKKFELAIVDKAANLAEMERREQNPRFPNNLQSAGLELDISSIKDESFQKTYKKFKKLIENGNLIAYTEEDLNKENALNVFRNLESNKSAEPVINYIKGELLAALQNRAQLKINTWLGSDLDTNGIKPIFKEIKIAFELIDSTDKQYYHLKSRYLLWKSLDMGGLHISWDSNRVKLLEECLQTDPDFPLIYALIGTHYTKDNPMEAIKYLTKAIELSPNWAAAYFFRSMSEFQAKQILPAYIDINKSLTLKPDFPEALTIKGYLLLNQKKYDEAIKCFDKALEIKPDFSRVYYNKGLTLYFMEKYEEAFICFDKMTELEPKFYEGWGLKGNIYFALEKYDSAEKCYDKQIELKPKDAMPWTGKGSCILNAKATTDYAEKAILYYDKAIELNPNLELAWQNKIIAFTSLKKKDDVIKSYTKALELNKDSIEFLLNMAEILSELKNYEGVIVFFDRLIELQPDSSFYWFRKAFALSTLGKVEESLKCSKKAIELKPNFYMAHDNLGYEYLKLSKYDEALKCSDKALEINPKYGNGWYNRACIYSYKKNKEEMLKCLSKAISLEERFKTDAPKDKDFKEYYEDPDFKKLVK